MPTQKDLKRLVRRRMQKTGESYTAARAQLLKTPPAPKSPAAKRTRVAASRPKAAVPAGARFTSSSANPADYAKLAGMSDAAVKAATGCDWKEWVDALDFAGAHAWPHRRIAEHLSKKLKVRAWWSQMVAVGYERVRGLREIGQRRDGGYQASKSRTYPVPVATLFDAFTSARARARWLPGVKLTVRKATPHRSVRITWEDDTSVEVWLVARGTGKSSAQVEHRKLSDPAAVARTKAYWQERLDALGEMLER